MSFTRVERRQTVGDDAGDVSGLCDGDHAIQFAVPEVDWQGDVLQPKSPGTSHEGSVPGNPAAARAEGVGAGLSEDLADVRAGQHRPVGLRKKRGLGEFVYGALRLLACAATHHREQPPKEPWERAQQRK